MALLPEIQTTRTTIVPFTVDHITPDYIAWLNDPVTVRYSQQRLRSHDEPSCHAFLKGFDGSANHFCAVTTEREGHIGNISTTVDVHNQVADVSILIGEKSLWGQGYGCEMWCAVMQSLFALNIRLVTGGCVALNKGMINLMEKAEMKPYYTRKDFFLIDGQSVDSVHYVAENKAWK